MQNFRYKWRFVTRVAFRFRITPERAENGAEWPTRPTRCDSFVFRVRKRSDTLDEIGIGSIEYKNRPNSEIPFPGQEIPFTLLAIVWKSSLQYSILSWCSREHRSIQFDCGPGGLLCCRISLPMNVWVVWILDLQYTSYFPKVATVQ